MQTSTQTQPQWEDLVIRPDEKNPSSAPVSAAKPSARKPENVPASYLTHELRAPVTAIRLGLEILSEQIDGRLDAQERQMLGVAIKNTSRLEDLVNDIMDYSKLVAGKLQLDKEPCEPRALLNEAADMMRAMAIAQGVKLVVDEGEPLPRVSGEARRVAQILTNLVSNAVKYTPARGTVTVSAQLGKHEHAGTVVFKVKDTGRGIPSKDIEKIFDMFIQSSNVKPTEGTGLGLTLARLMVEAHGGRIWAESWRGVGATFFFTIPITGEDTIKKVRAYAKPVEYHGLLVALARRVNSFLALFV